MTIFGSMDMGEPLLERFTMNHKKDFEQIEGEIKKIIRIIKKDFKPLNQRIQNDEPLLQTTNPAIINNSDHNRFIEKKFKEIFGLKEFTLAWLHQYTPNAFTIPVNFVFTGKNQNDKGDYKNQKLSVGVVIDIGLVSYCDMDEKEVLSIILHEIGHSFYSSIRSLIAKIPISIGILNFFPPAQIVKMIIVTAAQTILLGVTDAGVWIGKGMAAMQSLLYQYFPGLAGVLGLWKEFIQNSNRWFSIFFDRKRFKPVFVWRGFRKFFAPDLSPAYILDYLNEKYADSFAVDHGYGLPLATALQKIASPKNNISAKLSRDIPGFNWIMDLLDVQAELVIGVLDEHPREQIRIREGLERLKREARRSDIPQHVRKQLEEQIEEYEDFYFNKYLKINENENSKRIFSWATRVALENVFRGRLDPRDLVYLADPNRYK